MANTVITTSLELSIILENIAEEVINDVAEEVLKIVKERIMLDVYKFDYFPNKRYWNDTGMPTFQFLNAFQWQNGFDRRIGGISKLFSYRPETMEYDPFTSLHGNLIDDLREELAGILNVSGKDENNVYGGKRRQPYWDNILYELFSTSEGQVGGLDVLFTKAFQKRGITIKSIRR